MKTDKSVREMTPRERRRHSLTTRSFLGVQGLFFLVGVVILVAGFLLYLDGTLHSYCVHTTKLAQAETLLLDPAQTRAKAEEILKIYDSIPEEERGDGTGRAYLSRFDDTMDDEFREIQEELLTAKERMGLRNAFVVAIDEDMDRMVYLVDSDQKDTFCHPGTWDTYDDRVTDALVRGDKSSTLVSRFDSENRSSQATLTYTEKYGLRCTGGATLFKSGRYTVMVCLDEKLSAICRLSVIFLVEYNILLFFVTLIAGLIAMHLIRKVMVKPINQMADAARNYAEDREKEESIVSDHFGQLQIRSGDEIEELNLTMSDMEQSLVRYVENLTKATAEKERISTELGLAARIQEDMLPNTFPAFPERTEFDLHASMDPAKEVGGDFYDYFLIDEDHLALMIADVAGKGIPAALFMMMSKIMLDNRIMETASPAMAMQQGNEMILRYNSQGMFVTVWVGILEIPTGKILAANAGHEYPVIIHPDGQAELIKDKHGFVLGGMEGMQYREYELQLQPGAKLLLYTDGLPEATSAGKELFGTDRMLAAAGAAGDASPKQVLDSISDAVNEFVGDNEQFDDLTMLCVEYKGSKEA